MLTIDGTAEAAIVKLTSAAGVAPEGGLRIGLAPQEQEFTLSIAEQASADEHVVTADHGARVFLDPAAADVLADKVLDARTDAAGRFQFGVHQQQ